MRASGRSGAGLRALLPSAALPFPDLLLPFHCLCLAFHCLLTAFAWRCTVFSLSSGHRLVEPRAVRHCFCLVLVLPLLAKKVPSFCVSTASTGYDTAFASFCFHCLRGLRHYLRPMLSPPSWPMTCLSIAVLQGVRRWRRRRCGRPPPRWWQQRVAREPRRHPGVHGTHLGPLHARPKRWRVD